MTTNSIAVPQATAPQHTPIASSDRQAARPTMPHDSQAAMTNSAADPNPPWRMPTQAELRENPWVVPLLKVMVPGWTEVDPTLTMDVALVVAALERRAAASAQSPQAPAPSSASAPVASAKPDVETRSVEADGRPATPQAMGATTVLAATSRPIATTASPSTSLPEAVGKRTELALDLLALRKQAAPATTIYTAGPSAAPTPASSTTRTSACAIASLPRTTTNAASGAMPPTSAASTAGANAPPMAVANATFMAMPIITPPVALPISDGLIRSDRSNPVLSVGLASLRPSTIGSASAAPSSDAPCTSAPFQQAPSVAVSPPKAASPPMMVAAQAAVLRGASTKTLVPSPLGGSFGRRINRPYSAPTAAPLTRRAESRLSALPGIAAIDLAVAASSPEWNPLALIRLEGLEGDLSMASRAERSSAARTDSRPRQRITAPILTARVHPASPAAASERAANSAPTDLVLSIPPAISPVTSAAAVIAAQAAPVVAPPSATFVAASPAAASIGTWDARGRGTMAMPRADWVWPPPPVLAPRGAEAELHAAPRLRFGGRVDPRFAHGLPGPWLSASLASVRARRLVRQLLRLESLHG